MVALKVLHTLSSNGEATIEQANSDNFRALAVPFGITPSLDAGLHSDFALPFFFLALAAPFGITPSLDAGLLSDFALRFFAW